MKPLHYTMSTGYPNSYYNTFIIVILKGFINILLLFENYYGRSLFILQRLTVVALISILTLVLIGSLTSQFNGALFIFKL